MGVLLLGAGGYLGSVLKSKLSSAGYDTTCPSREECDLTKGDSLVEFLRQNKKFNFVINCAVFQKTGDNLIINSNEILLQNTLMNSTFAKAILSKEFDFHFITIGASCAYSEFKGNPNYLLGELHESVKCFAAPKRNLVEMLHICDPMMTRWSLVIPGTLVGPGEQLDSRKKHFFNGALFRAAMSKLKDKEKFEIFGEMSAVRDLSLVDNVASEIIDILCSDKFGIIDLIPDFRITVGQLYESIGASIIDLDRDMFKETEFKAQSKKVTSVGVKKNLVGTDVLSDSQFRKLISKTYKYYADNINKDEK